MAKSATQAKEPTNEKTREKKEKEKERQRFERVRTLMCLISFFSCRVLLPRLHLFFPFYII
jgi:hypothetical protein